MAATVRWPLVLARGGLIGLVFLVLWIWALVDVIRTPDDRQRNLPKPAWFFIVLLFSVLGAMAWIVFGRPRGAAIGFGGGRRLSDERDDARKLSERERAELERREYYKRMDEELDRRLEEKRRQEREGGGGDGGSDPPGDPDVL